MKRSVWIGLVVLGLLGEAQAAIEIELLVAPKGSAAYDVAKQRADDTHIFAARGMAKAATTLAKIVEACPKCPPPRVRGLAPPPCEIKAFCAITVRVAAGEYKPLSLPEMIAGETSLRILGGYNDDFTLRSPFTTPSVIAASGTAFALQGKDHALKELVLSGFVFDVGNGNQYDARSNSLLKGSSSGENLLTFGYLTTDRLVVADNIFLNSSHKVASPLIRAQSASARVEVRNNLILNNVLGWEVKSARWQYQPAEYLIEGNSFIMNWPFNPDATTSNPAALQIGSQEASAHVTIRGNLFAYNPGGAIYPEFEKGPPTVVQNNLFFANGTLFGESAPGAAAMAAKFGGFKDREIPWNPIDIETLEDELEYAGEGNVSLDPQLSVALVKPGFGNSNSVTANTSSTNDLRGMLGMSLQGKKMEISNFAPRMGLDLQKLPFPGNPEARAYGASPERVGRF